MGEQGRIGENWRENDKLSIKVNYHKNMIITILMRVFCVKSVLFARDTVYKDGYLHDSIK